MNKLAHEMGISKKTIYKYFTSKEDLVIKILEDIHEKAEIHFNNVIRDSEQGLLAQLHEIIRYYVEIMSEIKPQFLSDMNQSPMLNEKALRIQQHLIPTCFGLLFARGKNQGLIRKDIDTELISSIILGAIESTITTETLNQINRSPDEVIQTIFNIVLYGLLTKEGRKSGNDTI